MLTLDHGLVGCCWLDSEGPVLEVGLDGGVRELAADQPLCVKDCVGGVAGNLQATGLSAKDGGQLRRHNADKRAATATDLVLCRVADEALCVCEPHIRGGCAVAHIVGNNLHTIILPDADTAARAAYLSPGAPEQRGWCLQRQGHKTHL